MKIRVLHPITRLIIGGAQENTMLTADYHGQQAPYNQSYSVDIVSGPQTGPEGSLIEEVRARQIPLTIMPELRREISPINDIRAIFKLRNLMRGPDGKPLYDVVHTHSSKAGVIGRIAARLAGVPIIVHTVHGWSFHDQMSAGRLNMYVALEKLGARFGHAAIVVTERDIEKGVARGIGNQHDYHIIRSGVELDRFGHPTVSREEMRRRLGIPPDAQVVGSVTRLSPQKAPLDLIEALGKIAQQRPETWFLVVGDGPLRPEVEKRAAELNLTNKLLLTGLRRDVPELMNAMDVFTLSSLWEGLPRVLPQAMASGLPIVCTRADGTAEAIKDGHAGNGFLVQRGESSLMAERIVELLDNPELRAQMADVGRSIAPRFGARQMVADIDQLYQRLLNESQGS